MPLTASSKTQLNAVLSLLQQKDPEVCAVLASAARRRLDATNRDRVLAIIPIDGWSATPKVTEATALDTLVSDIAAN